MSCDRADTILHGYFDNELDALGAIDGPNVRTDSRP